MDDDGLIDLSGRTRFGPDVEAAKTKWCGWGWHCDACEVTTLYLVEDEAKRQASDHFAGASHARRLAER